MVSTSLFPRKLLAALTLVVPLLVFAADSKKKPAGTKVDLNLPSFGALPKGEGIEKPQAENPTP